MQGMMYFPSGNFFFKQYSNQWKLNIVMRAAHIFLTAIMKPETHCYTLKIYSGQIFKCQVHASFLIFNFFCFLGRHVEHMEVPSLGVKSELQLPAYTTATAMRDPSHVWNLHHSSRQRQSPDPLSEARDRIGILMDTSWICFHCTTTGAPK